MNQAKLLNTCTGFFILLLFASYYLAPDLRVSYFPSYLVGILGLWLSLTGRFNELVARTRAELVLLVILVLSISFSSLINTSLETSLLIGGYGLLILTFIYCYVYLAERLSWFGYAVLSTIVIAAAVSSVFSIYFFFSLDYMPLPERRLYALGGLSNPVVSAISYGAALTICISQLTTSQERGLSLLLAVLAGILLYAIALTGTRGVWIGLLAACLGTLALLPVSRKRKIMLAAGFVAAGLLLGGVGHVSGFTDLVMQRAFSFRPEIWSATISHWWSGNLLFGAGMDAIIDLTIPPNEFAHPHSLYISTLYYGGIVGLVLLFALIGRLCWVLAYKSDQHTRIYALPLLLFGLTTMLFDGNRLIEKVDYLWLAFWLPVALTLLARVRVKTTNQRR